MSIVTNNSAEYLGVLRTPENATLACEAIQHSFEIAPGYYGRFFAASRFATRSGMTVESGDDIIADADEVQSFVRTMRSLSGIDMPLNILDHEELSLLVRAEPLRDDRFEAGITFPEFSLIDVGIVLYSLKQCANSRMHTDLEQKEALRLRSEIKTTTDVSTREALRMIFHGIRNIKKRPRPLAVHGGELLSA